MKTFSQFLLEMPLLVHGVRKSDYGSVTNDSHEHDMLHSNGPLAKKISTLGNYHIYKSFVKQGDTKNYSGFRAIHKKTGDVHMEVSGFGQGKKFEVDHLMGHPDREIGAHDLYRHLVNNGHVNELHSDATISKGAAAVYKKLHAHPDLHVKLNNDKEIKNTNRHLRNISTNFVVTKAKK